MRSDLLAEALALLPRLSFEDKQGLRIISAVMKNKGTKVLRRKPDEKLKGTQSLKDLPYEEAKKEYQRSLFTSTYGFNYGRKDVPFQGEVKILKYKKISQLKQAEILNTVAKAYLDNWVSNGEEEYYVALST